MSEHMYEMLNPPIFHFYYRLQLLSGRVAMLTHYHRSRTTSEDQDEVASSISSIKMELQALWRDRSTIQQQTSEDLRSQFAPRLAGEVAELIGTCDAAYYAEVIEIQRVLGEPLSERMGLQEALRMIKTVVDRDCEMHHGLAGWKLHPGYLRPLFMYSIECMEQKEVKWAVRRIAEIDDVIYRSALFARFAEALSDAQLRKERRVTSKFFCLVYFGTAPPYM